MATISISRKHKKSMTDARASIDRVAKGIAKKFQVSHEWDGDTLHFSRPGVDGRIALAKGSVKVEATLGPHQATGLQAGRQLTTLCVQPEGAS